MSNSLLLLCSLTIHDKKLDHCKRSIVEINQKVKQKVWCKPGESVCNIPGMNTMNGAVKVNPENKMNIIVRNEKQQH